MREAQQQGMRNRTLVNRLFNGDPPNTEEERRAENLRTNMNLLDGTRMASNATNQLNNAFFKGHRFFSITLDKGDVRKRATWANVISNEINKELKKSRLYKCARQSAHAQVVLHGPGPLAWRNSRTPIPSEVGVEDVMLPSGTLTSMDNLDRFAIYQEYTWEQLARQTKGAGVDSGWNTNYVNAILSTLYSKGVEPIFNGNRWLFPEKAAEDAKEGASSFSSSLPKVFLWNFFYHDEDSEKWSRKIMLEYSTVGNDLIKANSKLREVPQYLYEKDGYADDFSWIIHWYIGNCSNVAPYRYYSIRSMGFLLYGIALLMNKLRNKQFDHAFQQLLTWFKNVSEDSREKAQMIDLGNFGIFPEGFSMVTANERHTADWNLLSFVMAQGQKLMAESASGFLPDAMTENTSREMTAAEWIGRMNMAISMTSAVFGQLADQSVQEYREICRRFCIKGNPDLMAKRFREALKKKDVPEEMLDIDAWEVVPEQTVGAGNKAAEVWVTQALMQEMFPLADPDGQRIIARRRYLALTDNPEEAMVVIPDGPQPPSNDVQYAQTAYSVLMLGVPFIVREGVNHIAYTAMLMNMGRVSLGQVVAAVNHPQGMAIAADKIVGLFNTFQHCQEQINIIGRAERNRDQAKALLKALMEMSVQLQQAAKQLMASEEQGQGSGVDPAKLAKIQEVQMAGEVSRQQRIADAELKREQKAISWSEENDRRNATTAADIQRQQALTLTEVQRQRILTAADVASIDIKTESEMLRAPAENAQNQ